MDSHIILGNLCTLLAMGANAVSSMQKTAKRILRVQNLAQLIYCASAMILGGYSAAVQNAVSILRNIAAIRDIKSKVLEWSLVTAGVVLGIAFNNRGFMGLLPVLGNLLYTLVIFRFMDRERLLKLAFLISTASFLVFNIVILNIVGAVSDSVVIVTTVVVLCRGMKKSE